MPEVDPPEVLGLHPSAELSYRVQEAQLMLASLAQANSQRAGGVSVVSAGTGSSVSRGAELSPAEVRIADLAGRLPPPFVVEEVDARIDALGSFRSPLAIFLRRECLALARVLGTVRATLSALVLAVRGEAAMTAQLEEALAAIMDARVPRVWLVDASGVELSWSAPSLAAWMNGLAGRDSLLRGWLLRDRPVSFWLPGFHSPRGFLAATLQEQARARPQAGSMCLDELE